MNAHVHFSAVQFIAGLLLTIVMFGLIHRTTLLADNRFTRAMASLGF